MIHKVFSCFDEKAGAFMQPFFSVNEGTAIRALKAAAQGESHLATSPHDFILYQWDRDWETAKNLMNHRPDSS